jgi:hypothetical protein
MKQVFKMSIPLSILFELLDKHCVANDKKYIVDLNVFRKIIFYENEKDIFLNKIKPYYHKSKVFYVTRKFDYNSMINLIRQICKSNSVPFKSTIAYNHSIYTIVYSIDKELPSCDVSSLIEKEKEKENN